MLRSKQLPISVKGMPLRSCARALLVVIFVLLAAGWLAGKFGIDSAIDRSAHARGLVGNLLARLRGEALPAGIVKSNGRLEATQVDVGAKYAGRLAEVNVNEGDEVTAGQVVGRITSPETEAQLRGAQAQVLKAKQALAEAEALIAQRTSDVNFTKTDYERARQLLARANISQQTADQRRNSYEAAAANYRAAVAQREQAQAAVKNAEADVDRLQAMLVDMTLVAPRSGRVLYLLSRSGEVVAAGARIMTILDLQDVYLTIYLPAEDAGRLAIGDEARIILDPVPQYVVPSEISFVASEAQFTPKTVETKEEREKLMFRVKLQISPEILKRYYRRVKTGLRGLGFVRTKPDVAWPADLVPKLPQ